jgi:hypothetical protein
MSALTLDGVGAALFGTDLHVRRRRSRTRWPTCSPASGSPWLPVVLCVRTPLPAAREYAGAKAELENVVDDLVGRAPGSQPAHQRCWTAEQPAGFR